MAPAREREAPAAAGPDAWRGASPAREAWRRLRADRAAFASLVFLGVFALLALLAPLWPLPAPAALDLAPEPRPPTPPWERFAERGFDSAELWDLGPFDRMLVGLRLRCFGTWETTHWLGTDGKGRDLLARIVWGSRISFQAALAASLVSLLVGVTYGAIAGYAGGRLDHWMMRLVDVLYSVPFIFLVIFLATLVNEYRAELARLGIERLHVFFVVIGLVWWLTMARIVRAQVRALKQAEFVQAARVAGASHARVLFVHLVPNVVPVVVVYLTLTIPSVMLFESFLSFLGLGVEPPLVSWGLLALDASQAIGVLGTPWWLVLFPSAAIACTLFALNVLGDGLRDALDPGRRP
jgi:oligopeptide transport system permease protein